MKKLFIIICMCLLLLGCWNTNTSTTMVKDSDGESVTIVKIGECQYIRTVVYNSYTYTHKGDCDNPIHIYNKIGE